MEDNGDDNGKDDDDDDHGKDDDDDDDLAEAVVVTSLECFASEVVKLALLQSVCNGITRSMNLKMTT